MADACRIDSAAFDEDYWLELEIGGEILLPRQKLNMSAYAASKAGMVALTKSIARGFGKQNITSFLVAPGWVKTDMNKETIKLLGEEVITKDLALNQLTEPKDLAPMVVLLASGLADHATGTTIDINAGSYVH